MTDSKNYAKGISFASGIAGLTALGYYALRVEPFWVERVDTTIPLSRLPAALEGLVILFIADMHTESWSVREERILEIVYHAPRPDLIVWGGDFLRGRRGIPDAHRLVRAVQAHFPGIPSYAIFGNAEHKLMLAEQRKMVVELESTGIRVLKNTAERLTLRGETISLVGVDDPYYGFADLGEAMQAAPSPRDMFTLLLAHSPQIATQAARAGIDLMLSGHTHGGQVRLPFVGPLKTQNPLCRRLDMGLFDRTRLTKTLGYDPGGDLTVYITRGIGLANVPHIAWAAPRFLCRPEVSVLTLCRTTSSSL